jgi:hypothetical protein
MTSLRDQAIAGRPQCNPAFVRAELVASRL